MRFVVLGHDDPMAEGFWSGIPRNIVGALRHAGHDVFTIGPLEPNVTLRARIKGRFHRHVFRRIYLINRDPAVSKARAVEANHLIHNQGAADAIIVTCVPDAAYLECPAPLILVHDATWHQLLDFYPGYERHNLAAETIEGGYELDRCALANCDRAIYASNWAAKSALDDYGIKPSKVHVVPLGAGLTITPSRNDIDQSMYARRRGTTRLLFVGFDWYRKGGDIAIETARLLKKSGIAVEMQIVGSEPPRRVPDFVQWFGALSKKDPEQAALLHRLFLGATFFLMPSRADCSPVVFCEAAAYGLPVVATNVGGIPEILSDREWGVMLPPSARPQEFAEIIRARLADSESYERMSRAARADFEERLNWSAFCRAMTTIVAGIGLKQSSDRLQA
jgi:glycosyltransferase involved in cell wall biosynthesis